MPTNGKDSNERPTYQPWYESDFWTLRVRRMHPMARLLYRALLQAAWDLEMPGLIKNDVPTIMAMCDCPDKKTWERFGNSVMAMFDLSEDGTMYTNQRQMQELQKFYARKQSWSDRGKKGNEARWAGKHKKTRGNPSNSEEQRSLLIAKGSQKDPLATISDPPPVSQPTPSQHQHQANTKPNKNSSAEMNSAPVVISLPLNDGTEYPISEQSVSEWKKLYLAVDVMQELRKMRGWLIGSPKRRKTKSGIGKFINAWLARAQDEPKAAAGFTPPASSRGPDAAAELDRQLGVKPQ